MEKQESRKLNLFGKEYGEDKLSDKQKAIINHIGDIDGKLKRAQFDVDQYNFCKISFLNELEKELKDEGKKE
jgi:hypothetical protein